MIQALTRQVFQEALLRIFGLPINDETSGIFDASIWEQPFSRPYQSVIDLLGLYASNLRNGGSPAGPRSAELGQMTQWVLQQSKFIRDDRLIEFDKKIFASLAAQYVKNHPLSKQGGAGNVNILQAIAHGEESSIQNKLLTKLVDSIDQFAKHLLEHYEGSASKFAEPFARKIQGLTPEEKCDDVALFRSRFLHELNFVLMGPAIASNFMKDSQIGRATQLDHLVDTYLGSLAKPDMHVFRMMLCITGRVRISDEDALKQLCFEQDFLKIYGQLEPQPGWPHWANVKGNEEICLRDLNFLAYTHDFPPIVLDRVLYMAGSGNSGVLNQHKDPHHKPTQLDRYRLFLHSIGCIDSN